MASVGGCNRFVGAPFRELLVGFELRHRDLIRSEGVAGQDRHKGECQFVFPCFVIVEEEGWKMLNDE